MVLAVPAFLVEIFETLLLVIKWISLPRREKVDVTMFLRHNSYLMKSQVIIVKQLTRKTVGDDDFNDSTFAPPLFEELIQEEQPFQIKESTEVDDEMEASVHSTPIVTKKAKKIEVNRNWRKRDEPMYTDPFLGPQGM